MPTLHSRSIYVGVKIRHRINPPPWILHLPNPPEPINRSVVEIKCRITGGNIRIAAGVDTMDKMACRVYLYSKVSSRINAEATQRGDRQIDWWMDR